MAAGGPPRPAIARQRLSVLIDQEEPEGVGEMSHWTREKLRFFCAVPRCAGEKLRFPCATQRWAGAMRRLPGQQAGCARAKKGMAEVERPRAIPAPCVRKRPLTRRCPSTHAT